MTFASYRVGQEDDGAENPRDTGPQIKVHDTVIRASTVDGNFTDDSTTIGRSDSNINPHAGTDSILSTARNKDGSAATTINQDTLLEIGGLQATVGFWIAEGKIAKAADGSYTEATAAPQEAPQADPDFIPFSEQSIATINQALTPVDQSDMDGLAAIAVGVGTGRLDASALVDRFSQVSGESPEASQERINTVLSEYQSHANAAVAANGIGSDDLAGFWNWAKAAKPGALADAMQQHHHAGSVAGYRSLASQYLAATPPSIAALKKAGLPVRTQGLGSEVWVAGSWMTPGAAARAGLI